MALARKGKIMKECNTSPFLYRLLRPGAVFIFKILFMPRVKGKENIPANGRVVLAGNHLQWWDCFMVMAGTKRCIHFLAKKEIFGTRFTKCFFEKAGLIPVDRKNRDKDALRYAKEYLENGAVVGVFPEGTVIKPEGVELLPFKMGAIKMASDTNSPIVPFTIKGHYIPVVGRVQIEFHPPYYVESTDLERENNELRERVSNWLAK